MEWVGGGVGGGGGAVQRGNKAERPPVAREPPVNQPCSILYVSIEYPTVRETMRRYTIGDLTFQWCTKAPGQSRAWS